MAKIFLAEDESKVAETVCEWLKHDGHQVESSSNGLDAINFLKVTEFDLIILDWNMPGMTGIQIIKELRDRNILTPVLMLTGRDEIGDLERGLLQGADDYLIKPCRPKEFSARVRALLRRKTRHFKNNLDLDGLEVDLSARLVQREGKEIKLQPLEYALLEFLIKHSPDVFSADALLARIWPSGSEASTDNVRVCVTRLRNKIDKVGAESLIRTIPKQGYQVILSNPSDSPDF